MIILFDFFSIPRKITNNLEENSETINEDDKNKPLSSEIKKPDKVKEYFKTQKNKNYIICGVCQELQYYGGLTNKESKNSMKRHLKYRHPDFKNRELDSSVKFI